MEKHNQFYNSKKKKKKKGDKCNFQIEKIRESKKDFRERHKVKGISQQSNGPQYQLQVVFERLRWKE